MHRACYTLNTEPVHCSLYYAYYAYCNLQTANFSLCTAHCTQNIYTVSTLIELPCTLYKAHRTQFSSHCMSTNGSWYKTPLVLDQLTMQANPWLPLEQRTVWNGYFWSHYPLILIGRFVRYCCVCEICQYCSVWNDIKDCASKNAHIFLYMGKQTIFLRGARRGFDS